MLIWFLVPGKQWHAPKTAFRPTAGQTSYAKRTEDRKAMAAMKAKEKEMKDEKEAGRQVLLVSLFPVARRKAKFGVTVAANTSYQGQESCERGERAV